MIRAIAREDLLAARELARELDRVLVRLGATVREEGDVEVARRDLGKLLRPGAPGARAPERVRVGELLRLRGDRVDDPLVAVADVHRHQLAVEVEDLRPSGVYNQTPSARSMAMGSTAPCADHEKKVCSRLRATISSVRQRPGAVPMPMVLLLALAGAKPD